MLELCTLKCTIIISDSASSSSDSHGNPLLSAEQIAERGRAIKIVYYGDSPLFSSTYFEVLYGSILSFAFIVIPFSYFFFEEDDEQATCCQV